MAIYLDDSGSHHAIGSDGGLLICLMKRPIDDIIEASLGRVLASHLKRNKNRIAYLHITSLDSGAASDVAAVRRHYGALMQRFADATGVIAFVAEHEGFTGALVRSGFTAVMALARSGMVGRAFSDIPAAAEWIERAAREQRVERVPLARDLPALVGQLRTSPTASRPRGGG